MQPGETFSSRFKRTACLLGLIAVMLSPAFARTKATVMLRVDDIFSSTSEIRPIEIDGFLKVAEKHGAKVNLAAVPARLLQPVNKDGLMTRALLDYTERGHQIMSHGYNHKCAYSGFTGREFSTSESLQHLSQTERIAKMVAGRDLLEAVLGKKISAYTGPGPDDFDLLTSDAQAMRKAGFIWLKNTPGEHPVFHSDGSADYPVMPDFAWLMTEETYDATLQQAKDYCRKSITEGGSCSLKFHDPFTRQGYKNGLVLKWLDEILTWLEAQPEWDIHYATLDEFYEEKTRKSPVRSE